MIVFGTVRILLGTFGALLVLQALFGIPYALSDGAWALRSLPLSAAFLAPGSC